MYTVRDKSGKACRVGDEVVVWEPRKAIIREIEPDEEAPIVTLQFNASAERVVWNPEQVTFMRTPSKEEK